MKLELYWPLSRPCVITQPFGTNGAYYKANGINITGHNGLDLLAFHGQPVHATHDGYARYFIDGKGGHGVEIRSHRSATMFGKPTFYKTVYMHFCDPEKEPQYKSPIPYDGAEHAVKTGDIIGHADSTGLSTGDHLHFGLKPIEKVGGKWVNSRQGNGYLGSVDPSFYMGRLSAEEYRRATQVIHEATEVISDIAPLPVAQRTPILEALSALLRSIAALLAPKSKTVANSSRIRRETA